MSRLEAASGEGRAAGPPIICGIAPRHSFTLIELMLVVGILILMFSLLTSTIGPRTIHGAQVEAAANQLASVLRKTRQLAMEHRAMYGVTFNIQNAPESTGEVLNNRSGGHWYRIIGPHDTRGAGYTLPLFFDRPDWQQLNGIPGYGDVELGWWLNVIQNDMVGEKYVLPKGQARFIALNDEDNGNNDTPTCAFGPTYPRPWFGEFVQLPTDTQPRLYTWGGYDPPNAMSPGFIDNFWQGAFWRPVRSDTTNYTGFYYQGDDPPIVGCVNPQDRYIIDDPNGTSPNATCNFRLFTKGEGRPLVNGDWLDCLILFNPDGSATMGDWMSMRHQYGADGSDNPGYNFWNDSQNHNIWKLSPGDMCNFVGVNNGWDIWYAGIPYNNRYEASDYSDVTGMYYITIGSDVPDDTVNFPSANAALASMLPLYRVGVSRLGDVKVLKVSTVMPAGKTLDTRWQGTIWTNGWIGYQGYWNNLALSASGQQLMPSEDIVTSDMMANHQWWFNP